MRFLVASPVGSPGLFQRPASSTERRPGLVPCGTLQQPLRRCKDASMSGGCRVGWSVVLGEFVGAHLLLVYGDSETGAERDVEVAVAQGGCQVGRLRAGEQQVV